MSADAAPAFFLPHFCLHFPPMYTRRLALETEDNALARAASARRAAGLPLLDLADANPARAGFAWEPEVLARAFSAAGNSHYFPEPRGLASARAEVAAYYASHGAAVSPEHIHLCASTSEACGWLLKLLTTPGDDVLVPAPSYPLLQCLAGLECVGTPAFPLRWRDGRWRVDAAALEAAVAPRTRAIFCVSPNNPTGSVFDAADRAAVREIALRHDLAIIADEVFLDYAADDALRIESWASETAVPLFALGGMSKTALLPQVKLAWVATAGPPRWRDATLPRLDFIADTYLSVSTPVQHAARTFFAEAPPRRDAVRARVAANERILREWCASTAHGVRLLHREAGWMVLLALPRGVDEERTVLDLAHREGVLVHPGYFYDMPPESGAFWVMSLLAPETDFVSATSAFDRVLRRH